MRPRGTASERPCSTGVRARFTCRSCTTMAGPLVEEEGILSAEMDAEVGRAARYQFDPVGHYGRPDVFTLVVDDAPKRSVTSE